MVLYLKIPRICTKNVDICYLKGVATKYGCSLRAKDLYIGIQGKCGFTVVCVCSESTNQLIRKRYL